VLLRPQLSSFKRDSKDIDGQDLLAEIVIFRTLVEEKVTSSSSSLGRIKKTGGSFQNITMAM